MCFLKTFRVFLGEKTIRVRSYTYVYACNTTHVCADSVGKTDFAGFIYFERIVSKKLEFGQVATSLRWLARCML